MLQGVVKRHLNDTFTKRRYRICRLGTKLPAPAILYWISMELIGKLTFLPRQNLHTTKHATLQVSTTFLSQVNYECT